MIQIIQLRKWTPKGESKPRGYDKFLSPRVEAPDLPTLFQNLDEYLAQIPESERWNLYYTACDCGEEKREFKSQAILPIDIDGLDVPEDWETQNFLRYQVAVCLATGVALEGVTTVFSGNGLQFVVPLKEPIRDEGYFDTHRHHYKALCSKVNAELVRAGLTGQADVSVFSTARLLRLPGTLNRKPERPERRARLIRIGVGTPTFELTAASGLPLVEKGHALQGAELKGFKSDSHAVQQGCEFLKYCKTNPAKVAEGAWYAMLSVVGRLENGAALAHEYSSGHPGYTHAETELKLEQALSSSGPRTCKNIESLWSGCHACPNFEKVKSPISIRGPDFIGTEDSGFHDVLVTETTGKIRLVPNYEDLRRYFNKERGYVVLGGSKIVYVWTGTHYAEHPDAYVENFAQTHFKPTANNQMVSEFRSLVQRTKLKDPDWFLSTTTKQVNFANGTLNLATGEFSPHDRERGFRHVLGYDYDPAAQSPAFDKFMREVTCGDSELELLLLEYAGYAISGDPCWAQKALVLEGAGANGKSTFMAVLRALVGQGNYSSLTISELRQEANRQMLDGKFFNIAEETPTRGLMDTSVFKTLVSGGETQVRQLYKNPYVMRNRAKLIFACNELPSSGGDTTEGFFRRFLIAPFRAEFSEARGNIDPFIEDKLLKELPGIFNRVLRAYRTLCERGAFAKVGAVQTAVAKYREELDQGSSWIRAHVSHEPVPTGGFGANARFAVVAEIYQGYAQDMDALRIDPINVIAFGKKLARLIPDYEIRSIVKKVQKKSARVLLGVSFESA